MTITLQDKTKASLRWIDGQARITFHGKANSVVTLPKGVEVTINVLQSLYNQI